MGTVHNQDRTDLDRYLEEIRNKYPPFAGSTGVLNTDGQNSDILVLDGEWVFRFPRYTHVLAQMEVEAALLVALQARLPLAIPAPRYLHLDAPPGQAFMGYQRIPGEPLWRQTFQAIHKPETLDRLAGQLGAFLKALHRLTQVDLPGLSLEPSDDIAYYQDFYRRIQEKLFPMMRLEKRQDIAAHFERYFDKPEHFSYTPSLRHGDFGTSNLLYDAARGELSGVIDFSGAALGDPAVDFAGLLICYGEDFIQRIARTYPLTTDFLARARFYLGTFALEEALFGYENGDQAALQAGLEQYI